MALLSGSVDELVAGQAGKYAAASHTMLEPSDLVEEKTLAIIKPDAVRKDVVQEILHKIVSARFQVVARAQVQLTESKAREFYAEHSERSFFDKLTKFMSSGPIVVLVLARERAVQTWRRLIGPSSSEAARAENPDCLRALYGTDNTRNAVHGSDTFVSARREIRFFFPSMVLAPVDGLSNKDYVEKWVQPVLLKGLIELCKTKPVSDPLEAISWLAKWLKENNPYMAREVPAR